MRALILSLFLVAIALALPAGASPTPGPIPSTVSGSSGGHLMSCRRSFSDPMSPDGGSAPSTSRARSPSAPGSASTST